jgi:hypothetical protein
MRLDDPHHRPNGVQDLRMGVIHVLPLRHGEESPVAFQSFLNRLDRSRTPSRNRYRDPGINHRIPKG